MRCRSILPSSCGLPEDDDTAKSLRGNLSCSMEHLGTPSMSTPTAVSRSNPVTPPTVNRSAATSPHRGSALWDDLNPSVGGTVSWKDTGQSIVVTYENVPEYSTSNDNTFQIEFFDSGDLRLSWLNIDLADAVVGLSAGTGSDPDFLPTDLSGLTTGCGHAATERDVAGLQHHARHDRGHPARGNG